MYAGRICERGSVAAVSDRPHHPIRMDCWHRSPKIDRTEERLTAIPGTCLPGFAAEGCRFHPRCRYATAHLRAGGAALAGRSQRHWSPAISPRRPCTRRRSSSGGTRKHERAITTDPLQPHPTTSSSRCGTGQEFFRSKGGCRFHRTIGHVQAARDVSFDIKRGETLAWSVIRLRESTLGRCIVRLAAADLGRDPVSRAGSANLSRSRCAAVVAMRRWSSRYPYASTSSEDDDRPDHRRTVVPNAAEAAAEPYRQLLNLVRSIPRWRALPARIVGVQRQCIGIAREPPSSRTAGVGRAGIGAGRRTRPGRTARSCRPINCAPVHSTMIWGVRHSRDRIAVMYLGKIVEIATREELVRVSHPSLHAGIAVRCALPTIARVKAPYHSGRGRPQSGGSSIGLPLSHPLLEAGRYLRNRRA